MITNQVLQNTLEGIRSITDLDCSVCDLHGRVLACTAESWEIPSEAVSAFAESAEDAQKTDKLCFFKIYDEGHPEYVLVVEGSRGDSELIGKMTAFQLQSLQASYKERLGRDNFIKNLLLDNFLLVDIYNRIKKLHIEPLARRVVMVAETQHEKDSHVLEIVKSACDADEKDFVTAVDEKNIIVVKEIGGEDEMRFAEEEAARIAAAVERETGSQVRIALGTPVGDIREVSRSYKEAKMALDVGKIFYAEKPIVSYSALGIGRLIYQLPIALCQMFIAEVFGSESPEKLDDETLITIEKFFENNLNVSEASRQLYIHRNTLVYRLDKLQKKTGLDLRVFEDAITFKIALMVVKYMQYMEKLVH